MEEPVYQVVWPLGRLAYQPVVLKPRPSDLNGLTIGELSDYGFRAEEIFPLIRKALSQRYSGIKFVEYQNFGNTHGAQENEVVASLAKKLNEYKCNAVISGVGG